jgi:hypothetical protein
MPTLGPNSNVGCRIVTTDGRGVALRATPGGDRLPSEGYDEGAAVMRSKAVTTGRGFPRKYGLATQCDLAPVDS